jgi:hypothetical protein
MARAGFWLQHAANASKELVEYGDVLASQPAGRPGVIMAPVNARNTLHPLFRQARAKGDAIVDPNGHFLDRSHTKRSKRHFPWLAQQPRPNEQNVWEAWMEEAINHQLDTDLCGAGSPPTFTITPSPIITADAGATELYMILDAASEVRQRQNSNPWLGICVDRAYLRSNPHRTRLCNAVVSASADGVVFRAFHSQLPPVTDRAYLEGLRELSFAASAGDVELLLPNAGWLGWLAMAWGAWGFSGGLAAASWGDREPGPMNSPDEPSNPYFEPQLMRTVRWRNHLELLNAEGYEPCACPECQAMGMNTYDANRAKRHQMWWANKEGAELVPLNLSQRRTSVRTRLEDAVTFREGFSASLQQRVGAGFLDTWLSLL